MRAQRLDTTEISKALGIGQASVYRILATCHRGGLDQSIGSLWSLST